MAAHSETKGAQVMKEPKKTRGIFEKVPGSGVWSIRYTDGAGKYRREIAGSYSQATKLLVKRRGEALQRKKLPETLRQRAILFNEVADDALQYSEQHKRSYRDDKSRMARLKVWFGNCEAESLTGPDIEKRLTDVVAAENWAASTFNHYRSLMMLVYREARRRGKVSVNPARDVRHKREDNSRVRILSDAEETKLRDVIQADWPEHMPEFSLAIATGLRKGSMYGLTWGMVDLEARMLHIPTTKNGEPLHVPLNVAALGALKAVHQRGDGTGRVFQSAKTGNPLQNGRHWFDDAVKKVGLTDFHWHDLRHCFASKLRMAGTALEDIADLLGHKSLTMTRRYSHLGPSKLHEVVARLDSNSTPVAPQSKPEEAVPVTYIN
jgi:integrase